MHDSILKFVTGPLYDGSHHHHGFAILNFGREVVPVYYVYNLKIHTIRLLIHYNIHYS